MCSPFQITALLQILPQSTRAHSASQRFSYANEHYAPTIHYINICTMASASCGLANMPYAHTHSLTQTHNAKIHYAAVGACATT